MPTSATPLHGERIEHGDEVGVVVIEAVGRLTRRAVGTSVAAAIGGDDAEVLREVGHRGLEELRVDDLEDGCKGDPRSALTPDGVPELHPVALDESFLRRPNGLEGIRLARRQFASCRKLADNRREAVGVGGVMRRPIRCAPRGEAAAPSPLARRATASNHPTASSASRWLARSALTSSRSANSIPSQNSEIQQRDDFGREGRREFHAASFDAASASRTPSTTTFFHASSRGRNFLRNSLLERLAAQSSACTRTKPEARSSS